MNVTGDTLIEPDETVRLHLPESGDLYIDGSWRESAAILPAGIPPSPYAAAVTNRLMVVAPSTSSGTPAPLRAWARAGGATGKWVAVSVPAYNHPAGLMHDWNPGTLTWTQQAALRLPVFDEFESFKLHASGDSLAVIPGNGEEFWIMSRSASGVWAQEATLDFHLLLLPADFVMQRSTATTCSSATQDMLWREIESTSSPGRARAGCGRQAHHSIHLDQRSASPLNGGSSHDGSGLVLAARSTIERRARDEGGPSAWGLTASSVIPAPTGQYGPLFWDNGDVLYNAPTETGAIRWQRRQEGGSGWLPPEVIDTDQAYFMMVGQGGMFLGGPTSWEMRERTSAAGCILDDDARM